MSKTTRMLSVPHIFASNGGKDMRRLVSICIFAVWLLPSVAQDMADMEKILKLKGEDSPENLDPYDVERLEGMLAHPLKLNYMSVSRLKESGLFTHYQAVSFVDYRSRHGDVLSFVELAAVDGFGQDFAERIAPFVSLESHSLPGQTGRKGDVFHELTARSAAKSSAGEGSWNYGMKYKIEVGEYLSGGLAMSRPYGADGFLPESVSGHVRMDFRKARGKVILGDFNARFGQGLALWNGLGLSGLAAPSGYMKRASGLSASSSFTGNYAMRGLAADYGVKRIRIAAFMAISRPEDGLMILPAVNLSWYGRNGQVGLTHYAESAGIPGMFHIPDMKTSADMCFCFNGVDLFAECAYDWVSASTAALAGVVFPAGDKLKLASMLRYYPSGFSSVRSSAARSTTRCSNEYAFSFSGETSAGTFAVDAAYFPEPKSDDNLHDLQLKFQTEWTLKLSENLKLKLRFAERIRSWGQPFRTDLRADMTYNLGRFIMSMRLNGVGCKSLGLLGYLECGYKSPQCSLYARTGAFKADAWDDRIYSYERDAPGAFSVPAYYGRGMWAAFTAGWRFASWGKIYARAAFTAYPFMEQKKPGKAELKLQSVFDF